MLKKTTALFLFAALLFVLLSGCSSTPETKIGMLSSTGTTDDFSMSSSVWNGIEQAGREYGVKAVCEKPGSDEPGSFQKETEKLYNDGCRYIAAVGPEFSETVAEAQEKYKNVKFIAVDCDLDKPRDNTVAVSFAEQEAGFLAAVASSLQQKSGRFAVLLPSGDKSVTAYKNGFLQGVAYANKNFGTNIVMGKSDYVFINGETDKDGALKSAKKLFESGASVIFAPCGSATSAVIDAAKEKRKAGKNVFAVCADSDWYKNGIYDGKNSAVMTSALKKADSALYTIIKTTFEEKFPGGREIVFNAKNDGVGLPEVNPNLREDVIKTEALLIAQLKSGELSVNE
ncbi:MAG: BMP family ABC transporter substrate-binding protein [Bacillota bacterium]|nr:BMP family ABC transporter substrate-binding protein [Bacillota bacterium]